MVVVDARLEGWSRTLTWEELRLSEPHFTLELDHCQCTYCNKSVPAKLSQLLRETASRSSLVLFVQLQSHPVVRFCESGMRTPSRAVRSINAMLLNLDRLDQSLHC